eukprot:m.122267 g.122267  ORF g.122267 m.122267 type:complete len:601 (-) comp14596_c3_seq2:117-1919(-)
MALLRFKCVCDDQTRIILLERADFARLSHEIKELFQGPMLVHYANPKGKLVPLLTQSDLDALVRTGAPPSGFRLTLRYPPDPSSPLAPGDQSDAVQKLSPAMSRLAMEGGGSRTNSPPPGFLQDPIAAAAGRRSPQLFAAINGGGEFIPEQDSFEARHAGPVISLPRSDSRATDTPATLQAPSPAPSRDTVTDFTPAADGLYRPSTFPRAMPRPNDHTHGTFPRVRSHSGTAHDTPSTPASAPIVTAALPDRERALTERAISERPADRRPARGVPRRWQRGKLLGSGAYGQVFLALDMDTGAELAVKQVELRGDSGETNLKELQALESEIALLRNLRHERIVMYYGTDRTSEHLTIFMEYVPGVRALRSCSILLVCFDLRLECTLIRAHACAHSLILIYAYSRTYIHTHDKSHTCRQAHPQRSLSHRLRDYGAFSEDVTRKYTRQLLEGLDFLHYNLIVHRDIKGANVLCDAHGCVKLADFGSSRRLHNMRTQTGFRSIHGTPYWMAPEIISGQGYGRKADIWALAATVVEMLTTHAPFSDCEPLVALFKIGQPATDFTTIIPEGVSLDGRAFLMTCFQRDAALRPSATDLLQHSFVRQA